MSRPTSGTRFAPLLAAVAVALIHGASLLFWFHSDDFFVLLAVRDRGPLGLWSGRGWNFFRPLSSLSHWLDFRLFGLNPLGQHAENVLLAMIAAALVVFLARRLAPSAPPWTATLAGTLFALMPAHAEAVDWISCRGDLLSADLGLGAIILALKRGRGSVPLTALFVALAVAAKEGSVGLPLFLGVVALVAGERRLLPATYASLGTAAAMVALRTLALGRVVGGYGVAPSPARVVANGPLFLMSALSPVSLQTLRFSPFGAFVPDVQALHGHKGLVVGIVALVALLLLGAVVALFRTWLRPNTPENRLLWATLAGFFVLALPAMLLGSLNGLTWEGSRYVYLPSASVAIFVALLLGRLSPKRAYGVGGALALTYALGSIPAVEAWKVAGTRTQAAVEALLGASGRVVAFAVPDSYRGAFILRNGTSEALELFRPGNHAAVLPLASYPSETATDTPRVVGDRVAPAPGAAPFLVEPLLPGESRPFEDGRISVLPTGVEATTAPGVRRVVVTSDGLVTVP